MSPMYLFDVAVLHATAPADSPARHSMSHISVKDTSSGPCVLGL